MGRVRTSITPSSVSRQLRRDAGHTQWDPKGKEGGFTVRQHTLDPVVIALTYRGVERDQHSREGQQKAFRSEMRRLSMSVTQVLGLHAIWGWDEHGEVDSNHLFVSMEKLTPPWQYEVEGPQPAEVVEAEEPEQAEPKKAVSPPNLGLLSSYTLESSSYTPKGRQEKAQAALEGTVVVSGLRSLFISDDDVLAATKAIAFAHAAAEDDKAASLERTLHRDTLLAIAAGAEEPSRMAALALETQHLPLPR
jgi:hypothetical protein